LIPIRETLREGSGLMEATKGLSERAVQALRQSPIPALRRVSVEETADGVVLMGRVSSYYFKQLAQETVLPHLAGSRLQNRVTVVRQEST
jgi:hypothetical protein